MIAAFARYAKENVQAADGFYEELLPAFERIQRRPKLYPPYLFGTQRLVLSRYPFSIVYRELLHAVQIIAVAHAKRKPGYWSKRT
jgi:toxin ParE1/3/4